MLSICLCTGLSIRLAIYLSICLSTYVSKCVHVSTYRSTYLSVYLSICLFFIDLSIYLYIYLKLASAQVRPWLLVSSSKFLTATPWRSKMLSLALLLSSLRWSSFVCRMLRRQLTEPPWHRASRTWSRDCEARRPSSGDGPSVLSTAEPVARPQEWTVTAAEEHDAPISRAECAAMITQALQDKVAPAVGAMHTHYGMQFQAHRQRTESLEQEVQKLKIRTAWVEKDVMYQQIEVAKRTLVLRGFPGWMSHADRELQWTNAWYWKADH